MIMEFLVGFIFGTLIVVIFSPSKKGTEEKEDRKLRERVSEYMLRSSLYNGIGSSRMRTDLREEIFNYIKYGTRKDKTDSTVD